MSVVAVEYLHHKVDSETRSRQEETRRLRHDIQEAAESAGSAINELQRTKADVSALSSYATQTYVNDQIGQINIPSLSGYATETYVNTKLNSYATTTALDGKVDKVAGETLATETYVNTQIGAIDFPSLSGYATIDGEETLTHKTLTTPEISEIKNGFLTLTVPTQSGPLQHTDNLVTTTYVNTIVQKQIAELLYDRIDIQAVDDAYQLNLSAYVPNDASITNFRGAQLTNTDPVIFSVVTVNSSDYTWSDGVLTIAERPTYDNTEYYIQTRSYMYHYVIQLVKDNDTWYVIGQCDSTSAYILTRSQWEDLVDNPNDLNPSHLPYPLSNALKGKLASLEARIAALEQAVAALA